MLEHRCTLLNGAALELGAHVGHKQILLTAQCTSFSSPLSKRGGFSFLCCILCVRVFLSSAAKIDFQHMDFQCEEELALQESKQTSFAKKKNKQNGFAQKQRNRSWRKANILLLYFWLYREANNGVC